MKILVTGHTGFLGKNLCDSLLQQYGDKIEIQGFNSKNSQDELEEFLDGCDFAYDFAAVHRIKDSEEFQRVNVGILKKICEVLAKKKNKCPILFTSSIQSGEDTAYGMSKQKSEEMLLCHARDTGGRAYIYRLTNIFGPGARPYGHSVVATFCHSLSRGQKIQVDKPEHVINFCYVADVVALFISHLNAWGGEAGKYYYDIPIEFVHPITVKGLAELLQRFAADIEKGKMPVTNNTFEENMLRTYRSYIPKQ